MSERPVTPYNLRLFAAAKQAMTPRPDPWALIDAHIREQRARGVDFGCWTREAEAKFWSRNVRWGAAIKGDTSYTSVA